MRPALSLKTLYRSSVRTILTFILLAAVTFALFSQVMEYSVAKREMEKMVSLYDGVLNIEDEKFDFEYSYLPAYMYSDDRVSQGILADYTIKAYRKLGYKQLSDEETAQISGLPYVTYTDTRYMTAGVSGFRRLDDGLKYYDYTNICVVEGTVRLYNESQKSLALTDVELIGGEAIKNSGFGENDIWVHAEPKYVLEKSTQPIFYWSLNGRAVTLATENSIYDDEYIANIKTGERYVFVLRYEDDLMIVPETHTYYLTDPFVYGQCDAVYTLAGEPENYLETEKFAPLKEYINIIETDQYTLDVVYTENMNSIRYFADGTLGISDGRSITTDDVESKNNVCVINYTFAMEYGLEVGDRITVNLGNKLFNANRAVGAISAVKERASDEYTEAELEIVGIFKDTRNKYMNTREKDVAWSYGINTVFVPHHLLSVSEEELENHTFHYGELSFVVEDAWNIPAFKKEVIPQIEEMGYTVYFEDDGFEELIFPIKETERIAIIKISVLILAIIVVTWFVSMLYIVGRRRDYAIMRLLGTDKRKAARALLLPLSVITIAAVLLGSIAAYVYTVQNIASSSFVNVVSGIEVDLSVPVWVVLACIAGEILLTLILSLALIAAVGRLSPLELMQSGEKTKRKKQRRKTVYVKDADMPVIPREWISIEPVKRDGENRTLSFILKYAIRHIKRTFTKAVLFVMVAVLLLSVLGQLVKMQESYISVFEGTEITSNFAGFMNLGSVEKLMDSGYVTDVFYCQRKLLSIDRSVSYDYPVTICNDIDLYAKYSGIEGIEVTWLDGYGKESMQRIGNVIIMGEKYMENNGFEIGQTVEVSRFCYYKDTVEYYVTNYMSSKLYNGEKGTEIAAIFEDRIYADYCRRMEEFLIIGSVKDPKGECKNLIMTPGSSSLSIDFGALLIPPTVSAVLMDNWKADEYREFALNLTKENRAAAIAFIMDTTKIENVRNNIELMNTLYPIMIAAVMIIAAFLCGMLIIQNSKDIAIMRVLGTSKRRVRAIMVLEHMILCIVGIVLAAEVLTVRGVLDELLWVIGLYVIVVFMASCTASVLASRKNVLELLQTKE